KTICTIGIPEEIHEIKAREDKGDMKDSTVHAKEKAVKEEEHDYDIPLHDGVTQPLTHLTVHITPPEDDYVSPATNPILNKHLNEFQE
ncbi:hypothetical protein Tco_0093956, partial [Tanacetum coccineum]